MLAQTVLAADVAATHQADFLAAAAMRRTSLAAASTSPARLPAAVAVAVMPILIAGLVLGPDVIAPAFAKVDF